MAKKQKSKLLAMALCASVMAGIYASPVLAADVTATQNANNDILFTVNGDIYTISRGSVASAVARNGLDNLTVGDLNITGAVTSNIHTYGSVTANANFLTRGGNFAIVGNTQYAMLANKDYFALGDGLLMNNEGNDERATFYVDNATGDVTSKGNVNANTFSNSSNTFNVAEDGAITAAVGSNIAGVEFNKGAIDFDNAQLRNIARVTSQEYVSGHSKFEDGKLTLGRYEGQELTAEQLANINNVIQEDGNVVANDITAADGAFKVREGVGETVIAGSVISSKDQFGNQGTFNGSYLNLQNADHTKNTSIDAGTAYFVNDGSGTSINGGAINAETLNGKNINDLVEGADIKEELANVAGIKRDDGTLPYGEGVTTIEGVLTVDGTDGSVTAGGVTMSNGDVVSKKVLDSGKVVEYSMNDIGYKTQNIDAGRTGESYTTFKGALNTDGAIRAAGGAVELRGNWENDGSLGLRYTNGEYERLTATQLGNINDVIGEGGVVTAADDSVIGGVGFTSGAMTNVVSINGASVEAVGDGGLSISGVELENGLVNGVNIEELDKAVAETNANVGGISRQQDENGVFYTNIEGTLTVSEKGLKAVKGDHAIDVNEDGAFLTSGTAAVYASNNTVGLMADANNYISITNNGIGLKGNVVFDTANYGSYTLSGLVDKVEDIYDRTQGISYDESTGTTTIDGDLNVKGNAGTGEGGNLNAGSGNFDKVSTDEVTVGDKTYIDGNSVNSVEGNFETINADKGNIGGVGLEGGTVTADKVVTGETTLDNEGLNVGGKTSVTADGVNVGGAEGTSIKHDEITVGDGGYIGGGDVVSGEGVSLNQTAERVGRLENKVGKLEDRIDKVGAMAAAIANLRTMGYDPAAPTEVAVGLGQYRDETGAALGLFHYPNRDFMLSLSVSTSGDEVMGGIGATWKFGRKSPEKVAEIKKAQAEADVRRAEAQKLAKAEELKAAAKEAKIKAQMERHAKLAAERAAEAETK